MQTSIATVSLSGDLAEKLEAIAAAGFTGVEIFESDLLSFTGTPKHVARIVAELGLNIVTFQPFRDFEGMPEPQRSRTFARAERKFDLMGDLGCDLLMICSNVAPDSLGASTAPRRTSTSLASARVSAASASDMKHWRGDDTSATTATRGRWYVGLIIRQSASRSTASTFFRARLI
jgi:sugar phosphate isomerase/epimerase